MSLYLCHECYCWVPPREGRCPQCDQIADSSVADPPLNQLERVIGDVVGRIGEVRFQRELLPECGTLYVTENGFFFLPQVLRHKTEIVEKTEVGRSLFWILASFAFQPLIFILPFIKSTRTKTEDVSVLRPARLRRDDGQQLAELLMRDPGVFFVARQSIHRIGQRRKRWTIERRHGPQLRFTPVANPQLVAERMQELVSEDAWRDMADV